MVSVCTLDVSVVILHQLEHEMHSSHVTLGCIMPCDSWSCSPLVHHVACLVLPALNLTHTHTLVTLYLQGHRLCQAYAGLTTCVAEVLWVDTCCRSAQELKCSLKGLALEPRLAVSHPQLLFGEVASHDWADQNLMLANQGSTLPLQFRIQPSPYFHCLPHQGEGASVKTTLTLFAVVPSLIHCTNDLTSGCVCSLSCLGILTLTAFAWIF